MITCKEDLINTYVKTDGEELVRLYLEKCKEFGFTWFSGADISSYKPNGSAVGLNKDITLSVTNGSLDYFDDENCRELTLSDLKPTPTKFVKVEESIFDLKGEFERGELYFDVAAVSGGVFLSNDEYVKVNSKESLCECYSNGNVYRQVEIDWRDELDSYLDSISSLDSNFDEKVTLEFSKSNFAYNLSDDEFVAVCHLVTSLTEKPEGV